MGNNVEFLLLLFKSFCMSGFDQVVRNLCACHVCARIGTELHFPQWSYKHGHLGLQHLHTMFLVMFTITWLLIAHTWTQSRQHTYCINILTTPALQDGFVQLWFFTLHSKPLILCLVFLVLTLACFIVSWVLPCFCIPCLHITWPIVWALPWDLDWFPISIYS